jgi:superfamily II DNA or RNA helicase
VVGVLPTGGGKTVIFTWMGKAIIERQKSVWFLAHRQELCEQISGKLLEFGVPHGLIMAGMPMTRASAQVGMIGTVKNRLGHLPPPDLLVVDECHHTPAASYAGILAAMPPTTKIVGFTATPERLDGTGLSKFYDDLVCGPSTAELIELGYLAEPIVYAPKLVDTSELHSLGGDFKKDEAAELLDKPAITGDAIEHYKRLAGGTSAVAFCVTVDHAIHVANKFSAAGIPAAHVDGSMGREVRKSILDRFRSGEILVLTSADLISEGFDLPRITTAILLRPTKSLGLYLQQVGRSLRVDAAKSNAIILDHVQNCYMHGLPTADREWSLEGRTKKRKGASIGIKTCSVCFIVYQGKVCPQCKVAEPSQGRQIEEKAGELVQIADIKLAAKKEVGRARSLDALRAIEKQRNYKSGWADHVYAARQAKRA